MPLAPYAKAVTAVVGMAATLIFDVYGEQLGLPPDWPQTVTAVLTPILVYAIPNRSAS